jgi:ATP-dependent Clp protease ATP-binding subunit ClpC
MSKSAQRALALARYEARATNARIIDVENVLYGVLRETDGAAARLLARLGHDPRSLAHQLGANGASEQTPALPGPVDAPYSPAVKQVIRNALSGAEAEGATSMDTDHLLLALLANELSPAVRALRERGLTSDSVRAQRARMKA